MDELSQKRFEKQAALIASQLSEFDTATQALAKIAQYQFGLLATQLADMRRVLPENKELLQLDIRIDATLESLAELIAGLDAVNQSFSDIAIDMQRMIES